MQEINNEVSKMSKVYAIAEAKKFGTGAHIVVGKEFTGKKFAIIEITDEQAKNIAKFNPSVQDPSE